MKVSVITVCYNSEKTIASCIKSVVDQDYSEIEHIIIDGASTDRTVEVIKEVSIPDKLISEPDHGIYDAMNKGLILSTGDVVCFLNSDDQYAHNKVISMVVSEMTDDHLDALVTDVVFFNLKAPNKIIRRFISRRFSLDGFSWGWMPAHPGLFLSKKVISETGLFNSDYKIAGDFEYIIRAFHQKSWRYKYLPEVTVRMLIGGVSTSGLGSKITLNLEMLKACRENGIKTNLIKILLRYPLKLLELLHLK
jgi:glycosyltransferase involved in cell wall biosynthesis